VSDGADADVAAAFGPVGSFSLPSMPAQTAARSLVQRARRLLIDRGDDAPFVDEDKLQKAAATAGEAHAPACDPLLDALDAELGGWLSDPSFSRTVRTVLLPPCDRAGLIEAFAQRHGLEMLAPPDPAALLRGCAAPSLAGEGVLVIPRLEAWFLRHRRGLGAVRELLSALGRLERRCLVGCNSWAWAFLVKAVEANHYLPRPLSFEPFDGAALRSWFGEVVTDANTTFLMARTGEKVHPAGDGDTPHAYFRRLAAESRGIPWVAWWLWRESLRVRRHEPDAETETGEGPDDGGRMPGDEAAIDAAARGRVHAPAEVFVRPPETMAVPDRHAPDELLMLHALLIHDALTPERLFSVIPTMRDTSIVASLMQSGLIERDGDRVRCRPAAYPAIRSGLIDAGFSGDRL